MSREDRPAAMLVSLGACGGIYYTVNVNAASTRLEQAKNAGAERMAPFEYYYAKAHLDLFATPFVLKRLCRLTTTFITSSRQR